MYRIVEGSGTGKTRRLMQFAKDSNATYVCSNPDAMAYKAQKYGIDGIHFISYGDFMVHKNHYPNEKYVIDELENFLTDSSLFYQSDLLGYTISVE